MNPETAQHVLLSDRELALTLRRLASEIVERHPTGPLAFVGIHTRGVVLANRVYAELAAEQERISRGTLDIALYRDDLENLDAMPKFRGSDIPFEVAGARIILFDDVLFTGRTIRAAIDVLLDYGRPASIQLAVLADRGHRELPIAADFVGLHVKTEKHDHLRVHFMETDGSDGVVHLQRGARK